MIWKMLWYEEDASGVELRIIKMERYWDLIHYCVLMHRGITLFLYDSTDAYANRQGNDHYVWYSVAVMAATPNGCLASTTPRECSPD